MLVGEKVLLTSIRNDDSETLFNWINDPETVRFNSAYTPVTQFNHCAWLAEIALDKSKVVFAIRLKSSDELIGLVQLVDIHPVHRSAEMIIRLGEESHRGRGFGTEAIRILTTFAWTDLNLERLWLRVFADNERATKTYEKCGFKFEGLLRKSAWISNKWIDIGIMAILRTELALNGQSEHDPNNIE